MQAVGSQAVRVAVLLEELAQIGLQKQTKLLDGLSPAFSCEKALAVDRFSQVKLQQLRPSAQGAQKAILKCKSETC